MTSSRTTFGEIAPLAGCFIELLLTTSVVEVNGATAESAPVAPVGAPHREHVGDVCRWSCVESAVAHRERAVDASGTTCSSTVGTNTDVWEDHSC